MTVKIRVMGTLEECLDVQEGLNRVFDVLEVSGPYPNRGKSRLCRLYAEVEPTHARRAGRERPQRGHPQDGGLGDEDASTRPRATINRTGRELPAP